MKKKTIKNKYNIGDIVYYFDYVTYKVKKGKIKGITIDKDDNNNIIVYHSLNGIIYIIENYNLFKTKKEAYMYAASKVIPDEIATIEHRIKKLYNLQKKYTKEIK